MPLSFQTAIVRSPCQNLIQGIRQDDMGQPDFLLAKRQHTEYIQALQEAGLAVHRLEADNRYPDSCFVEDTAICTAEFAILCNPCLPSRQPEATLIKSTIEQYYPSNLHLLSSPQVMEGGDVMMVDNRLFIGLSKRTNKSAILALHETLQNYGWSAYEVPIQAILHLKTGVSYLENNTLLIREDWQTRPCFSHFTKITVPLAEQYAANCIWVNDCVIMPAGYPITKAKLTSHGLQTLEVPMSEFRKIDGGVSCLSLRF
jgi:dimethylargininase